MSSSMISDEVLQSRPAGKKKGIAKIQAPKAGKKSHDQDVDKAKKKNKK
jgi:hypothetical protein